MPRSDVLFLTTAAARGGGGVQHTTALLQAFSAMLGPQLTVVGREELQGIPLPRPAGRYIRVPRRHAWQKVWWLATARGYDLLSPFVDNWLRVLADRPACVILDPSRVGRFAPRFAAMGSTVVTMHHNVEVDYVGSTDRTPFARRLLLHIVRKNERSSLLNSHVNLTMTGEDAVRLRSVYGLDETAVVEPLGTFDAFDAPPVPVLHPPPPLPYHIIMTGSLCDHQTIDGFMWFLLEVYPLLKARLPEVRVTIAGRLPTPGLIKMARTAGVALIANPANMDDEIRQAHVYLAPARLGSGLKLRLKDALRVGLPIVSHSVSARGYTGLLSDPFLQVFETSTACIEALVRIYRREPLDLGMRRHIQQCYLQRFSFASGVARLESILRAHIPRESRGLLQQVPR